MLPGSRRKEAPEQSQCVFLSFICNFPYLVCQDEPDQQALGCQGGPGEHPKSTCPSPSVSTLPFPWASTTTNPSLPGRKGSLGQAWHLAKRGSSMVTPTLGKTGPCSSPSPEIFQLGFNFFLSMRGANTSRKLLGRLEHVHE